MKRMTILAIVLAAALAFAATDNQSTTLFESPADPTPQGKIDELVFARLKAAGIQPAKLCSDEVFVRRVYLDVIGTLPTAEQARNFLENGDPEKRSKLIDRLMEREEFADYRAMRWGDLLRVKSEFPINLWPNAVQAYHRWIRTALSENMPYDRFVRELLTSSGSNFRVPQVNFYRAVQSNEPPALAKAVALTFMGDRMDSWPEDRTSDMAVFFRRVGYKRTAEWKEEIVFFDLTTKAEPQALLPDGTVAKLPADRDPREVLADWLITPENPWFVRCAVNRIWYWLLGRGIVHEPDDVRADNPPSLPLVLALLEKELVAAKYNVKHIYRRILNSSTYQLSSIPRSENPRSAVLFAYYPLRRLDAEVLIDALCQLTGTTEEYSSSIPEPFTWIPGDKRSIALPDGSITSSFLELFGRPPRDTGMAAERNNNPTAAQALHLLNSSHIRNKIQKGPGMKKLAEGNSSENLYLAILSRLPGDGEGGSGGDLAWTLINITHYR